MSEENKIPSQEIPQNQPVNKEPIDENISSAEPIAEAEQPHTINYKHETENMEVHHHGHHEGKKNWRSYFCFGFVVYCLWLFGFGNRFSG